MIICPRIITAIVRLLPLSSAPLKIDLEVELTDPMDQLKKILVEKLLDLKLLDIESVLKTTNVKAAASPDTSDEFEIIDHSDLSSSSPTLSAEDSPPLSHAPSIDKILSFLHFQFGCFFSSRPTSVFKNYDSESATKSSAIHIFVGKYDTLIAFQLEHEASLAKIPSYSYHSSYSLNSAAATTASTAAKTFCFDIIIGKKERSVYTTYDSGRLDFVGHPFRVSFPANATNRDVWRKVSEISRPYFREDSSYCNDYDSKELTDRPFEVVICSTYNQYTSRKIADVNDDIFPPLAHNELLCIAWTIDGIEKHFDEEQLTNFRIFSSALQPSAIEGNAPVAKLNIYDCIDKFIEREQLASTETMYCSNCKQHLAPIKKFDFWSTPGWFFHSDFNLG